MEKPHLKVEDEGFQNLCGLAYFVPLDFAQKWEQAKIPILNFPQFAPQKLAKRPEIFPQIGEKRILLLVKRVDLAKNVKKVARKLKVGVDKGVGERKVDVTESTKRVF